MFDQWKYGFYIGFIKLVVKIQYELFLYQRNLLIKYIIPFGLRYHLLIKMHPLLLIFRYINKSVL